MCGGSKMGRAATTGVLAPAVISTALRCHLSAAARSPRLKRRKREYLKEPSAQCLAVEKDWKAPAHNTCA